MIRATLSAAAELQHAVSIDRCGEVLCDVMCKFLRS